MADNFEGIRIKEPDDAASGSSGEGAFDAAFASGFAKRAWAAVTVFQSGMAVADIHDEAARVRARRSA